MVAKTVMVMGTASSVGKSLLTTAICRCMSRRGFRVAPFKAQNLSNNAAVCESGGEIGRSQFLQAIAAGVTPQCDMNPVLLKPEGDARMQVIVNGHPMPELDADNPLHRREQLWPHVTSALDRLRCEFDVVVIEGAGSPAELNLADSELVNFSIARYARSPVLLAGDIERGGVFAQLLGTIWLLEPDDRALIRGLIVNKFRGDQSLFKQGVQILEDRGGIPVFGVIPWMDDLQLPEEDSVALDSLTSLNSQVTDSELDIAVIRLPHIANFDDFDPLDQTLGVALRYVQSKERLGTPDVIILPGTKNTLDDTAWLTQSGLGKQICELREQGASVVGICGGYQMLGKSIDNPERIESDLTSIEGLGLLQTHTVLHASKQTRQATFSVIDNLIAPNTKGLTVSGYEIHCGQTIPQNGWLEHDSEDQIIEGSCSADSRVWGCYLHGLFHNDDFRNAWLRHLGWEKKTIGSVSPKVSSRDSLQLSIDHLADCFETHMDMDGLERMIFEQSPLTVSETTHAR